VRWLEKNEFIAVTNRAGAPNVIRLLSDGGAGADYETPGSAFTRLRPDRGNIDGLKSVSEMTSIRHRI
jgi:hypothetical protein